MAKSEKSTMVNLADQPTVDLMAKAKQADVCCLKCGEPIGNYVREDGKVLLLIGSQAFLDAWARCEKCKTPWIWHSSDQALAHLVERVLERRKVDEI